MSEGNLVRSSAKVSAVKAGGSFAGLFSVLFLAGKYGSSSATDAYFIGRLLPSLIGLYMGRALCLSLVRAFSRVDETQGRADCQRAVGAVFSLVGVILLGLTAILFLTGMPLLHVQAPGFELPQYSAAWEVSRLLLPLVVMLGLIAVVEAYLNITNVFIPGEIALNMLPVGSLLGAVLLTPIFGLPGVAVGTLSGTGLGFLCLMVYAYRSGLRPNLDFSLGFKLLRQSFKSFVSFVSGVSANQIVLLFAQGYATTLGSGAASIFSYALRIVMGFPILVGMAIGKVLMPQLVKKASSDDPTLISKAVRAYVRGVCLIFVPFTALILIFSNVLVSILFSGGDLTIEQLATLSATIKSFAWAVLMGSVTNVIFRTLHSIGSPTVLIATSGAYMLAGVGCMFALSHFSFLSVPGLGGAISLATTVQTVLLFIYLNRKLSESIVTKKFWGEVGHLILAVVLASLGAGFVLSREFFIADRIEILVGAFFSGCIFMGLYFIFLLLLRFPEAECIAARFRRNDVSASE